MDQSTLRQTLSQTNMSAPSIQKSASSILGFYSTSPSVAVTEWRNALQSCRENSHLLPLLYVANEVLQTSKRNRGSKFLETFSGVLRDSLILICERDRNSVEKVRRTVKIWGDRRVFSVRFVSELLTNLEPFRTSAPASVKANPSSSIGGSSKKKKTVHKIMPHDDSLDSSDHPDPLIQTGPSILDVDVTISASATKRKRTSTSLSSSLPTPKPHPNHTPSPNSHHPPQPPKIKILSNNTFHYLLTRLEELENEYSFCMNYINNMSAILFDEESVEKFVGDELCAMHEKIGLAEKKLLLQRRRMYEIAKERRELESEAVRYIPRFKMALVADEEDLQFCDTAEDKLKVLNAVIEIGRTARTEKIIEEEAASREKELQLQKMEAEDERRKSLEKLTKEQKNQIAKPGMVWNSIAREYQYINDHTNDDWRD